MVGIFSVQTKIECTSNGGTYTHLIEKYYIPQSRYIPWSARISCL